MPYKWDDKDPRDKADYLVKWDQTVEEKDPLLSSGEKLTSSTWSIARKDGAENSGTNPLVIEADEIVSVGDGTDVWTRVWLSGGEIGVVYELTNEVETDLATPNRWNRKISLKVKDL